MGQFASATKKYAEVWSKMAAKEKELFTRSNDGEQKLFWLGAIAETLQKSLSASGDEGGDVLRKLLQSTVSGMSLFFRYREAGVMFSPKRVVVGNENVVFNDGIADEDTVVA